MSALCFSDKNTLKVAGKVIFSTVVAIESAGLNIIKKFENNKLTIDLSGIIEGDNSALAMMLSWMREANHQSIEICFINFPEKLKYLAKLCGVDEILIKR